MKRHFLKKQLYLEKIKVLFSNFCSKKGKNNIARILIRYFRTNIGNFDIFFKVTAIFF
jgi:hypothetical protein